MSSASTSGGLDWWNGGGGGDGNNGVLVPGAAVPSAAGSRLPGIGGGVPGASSSMGLWQPSNSAVIPVREIRPFVIGAGQLALMGCSQADKNAGALAISEEKERGKNNEGAQAYSELDLQIRLNFGGH